MRRRSEKRRADAVSTVRTAVDGVVKQEVDLAKAMTAPIAEFVRLATGGRTRDGRRSSWCGDDDGGDADGSTDESLDEDEEDDEIVGAFRAVEEIKQKQRNAKARVESASAEALAESDGGAAAGPWVWRPSAEDEHRDRLDSQARQRSK
jgi:hypothetical protein